MRNLLSLSIIIGVCISCVDTTQVAPTSEVEQTLTPTINITPIPSTATLSPTLPEIEPEKLFEMWISGDATCSFPCWAGILPGQTTLSDAIAIISKVVVSYGLPMPARCRYGPCHYFNWQYELNGELFAGLFFEKNNLVHSIILSGGESSSLNIYEILKKYGQPDQIFLSASSYTPDGEPSLDIILLYKENKFVARYTWWAEFISEKIVACGLSSSLSIGIVAIKENNWSSIEISQAGDQLYQSATLENFRPLDEVSELSSSDFYQEAVQNTENFCVSTPTSFWQ